MIAAGQNPSDDRKKKRAVIVERNDAERRLQSGEPPIGSFEEVARRWFSVRMVDWMESYSAKVLRRLDIHVFPYVGTHLLQAITPKTVLDVCRRVESQGTGWAYNQSTPSFIADFHFDRQLPRNLTDSRRLIAPF